MKWFDYTDIVAADWAFSFLTNREVTRALFHLYGIEGKVYGIVGGYKGFYDPKVCLQLL